MGLRTPIAVCALLASALLSGNAGATTYYVAPASCSDSQPASSNSQSSPFCTPQHAAEVASAGDVVSVGDGTYTDGDGDGVTLDIVSSGTSTAPITFRSENRWGAKLVGQVSEDTYCVNTHTATAHIVIAGFDLSGCSTAININNDNHFVNVIGNHIHDIARFVSTSTYGHDGISYGGGSTDVLVDGNLFHTIGRLPGSDYPNNHDHGIYIRSARIKIINNVFYDFTAGWAIHIYGPDLKQDISIINNTFAEPNPERDGHIIITDDTDGVLVRNNVFNEPTNAAINVYSSNCPSITNVVVDHNITTTAAMLSGGDCGFQLSANTTSASIGLVDAPKHDYHLQPSSPAIDQGDPSGPDHDYDGVARPQGAAIDLGAFEYTSQLTDGGSPDAGAEAAANGGSTGSGGGNSGASGGVGGKGGGDSGASVGGANNKASSSDDSGCGCRVAPSTQAPSAVAAFALALVAFAFRKNRTTTATIAE